ncbi:PglL family O-oligosaccharyltransferase [Candidatus Colwellia aromaticivorans]|uniref:PglL family O-oligosaccharyltransferase n=1 Tax=Candidatus Colwellia aromaticivorans TaxID=2267621 RepID=UPI0014445990|nr:PglL family O-oligosaccharyltransferase [Candidatus Colwellia aromaticivorans]
MHIVLDTPGGTGLYLSFNIIAWLFVVILIALGFWQVTLNKKIVYSKMLVWLSVGCLCLFVSAFYSFEFTDHAIPRLLALTGGLLLLFCLYQFPVNQSDKDQLLILILIAVALESCLGLVQYFFFEEGFWGGYKVGISRPHGVFLQPNVMASFMATGLAIALFISTQLALVKSRFSIPFKGLIYFTLFSTSFLLVVLQSRTGHLSALLILALIAPYLYQKSRKQLSINVIIITLALITAVVSFKFSDVHKRGSEVYQSIGSRSVIYEVSIDMFKAKPLFGYGYGGFERSFIDHFNQYAIEHPEVGNTIQRLSHPHNEVLFWVVEGGIVALLAFMLFTIAYITTWLNISRRKALALFALLLPILLHSQLEFPFYSSVSHFLVFLIILWLTDTENSKNSLSFKCTNTFLLRFIALLIPAIFVPFLATSLHTANILVDHEKNGYQSIEKLNDIINPIAWQNRLDAAVYAHILVSGLIDRDSQKLERYIAWAQQRIKYMPRESVYANLLLALSILNKDAEHQQLLIEAKQTYPQRKNWKDNILSPKK